MRNSSWKIILYGSENFSHSTKYRLGPGKKKFLQFSPISFNFCAFFHFQSTFDSVF